MQRVSYYCIFKIQKQVNFQTRYPQSFSCLSLQFQSQSSHGCESLGPLSVSVGSQKIVRGVLSRVIGKRYSGVVITGAGLRQSRVRGNGVEQDKTHSDDDKRDDVQG